MEGIFVPVITPIDEQERVDEPAMRKTVNHVLEGGIHAVFAMGSTGECTTLIDAAWRRGIETVIDEVGGRVPVLAGISAPGTQTAIQRLEVVQSLGADMAVATLPYYYRLNEDEMVNHYRALAEATCIPIYAYNMPLTKMTFTEQVVGELVALETIVGYKDSSSDFTLFQKLVARFDNADFSIFQGNETMLAHSLFAGASGGVVGLGNIAPRLCVELYETCREREYENAYALQRRLVSLHRITGISSSSLSVIKYATSLLGLGSDRATKPFNPLTRGQKERVESTLRELDLL
jgi:4-hydroxy-tetrahydrodipicolinate synthase